MQTQLVYLAEKIAGGPGNTPANNHQFISLICDTSKLSQSLAALTCSDTYVLVYSSAMIKLVEKRQFLPIIERDQSQGILNQRYKAFAQIMIAMGHYLHSLQDGHFLTRTIIDLIGLLLKNMLEVPDQQYLLLQIIGCLLPSYELNTSIIDQSYQILCIPMREIDVSHRSGYCKLVKVFVSMLNYISSICFYQDCYQYRNDISAFKKKYLAYVLKFTVQHLKHFFAMGIQNSLQISLSLQLLSNIFTYPFGLAINFFQGCDDDIIESYASNFCDINFPSYFLHVICDEGFMGYLQVYYFHLFDTAKEYSTFRTDLINLLKIIGRAIRATPFLFRVQQHKENVYQRGLIICERFCENYKFYNQQYLLVIIDILHNFCAMNDCFVQRNKAPLIEKVLYFFMRIAQYSHIHFSQGANNPINRVMQALALKQFFEGTQFFPQHQSFQIQCQSILEHVYKRIESYGRDIMNGHNFQSYSQITDFKDFYSSFMLMFIKNIDRNIQYFMQLQLQSLNFQSKVMIIHLCSQFLLNIKLFRQEYVDFILKYRDFALTVNALASLRYIRIITEKIMDKMKDLAPTSQLWVLISSRSKVTFNTFIHDIISLCVSNFNNANNQIVEYSLEFFKSVYSKLKTSNSSYFRQYQQTVNSMLSNSMNKLFSGSGELLKRKRIYNVISVVYINQQSIQKVQEFYRNIINNVKFHQPLSFCQYLFDLAGFIEPITHKEPFQAIISLCLADLAALYIQFVPNQIIQKQYFSDHLFVDITCKLLYCITSNEQAFKSQKDNSIPLDIYQAIRPYVLSVMKSAIQIPKSLMYVLISMARLNPLEKLINFQAQAAQMKSEDSVMFSKLISTYFEHIRRVQEIGWMYGFIQQNVDFMVSWWEETILRQDHPNISLKNILQSNFWIKSSEKEKILRLIYEIGSYDKSYWDVTSFATMKDFVNSFKSIFDVEKEAQDQNCMIRPACVLEQDHFDC